jgi:pimeloyl-ACP methyl ester carboxylesterase
MRQIRLTNETRRHGIPLRRPTPSSRPDCSFVSTHARLEVFDRCRMMPQEEHAERFNALLRDAFRAGTTTAV